MSANDNPNTPIDATAYAVDSASTPFRLLPLQRRAPRADDVVIRIHFCGICHSDIHQVYNDWYMARYPLVPGHEITGVVKQVGSNVKGFSVGDHVGVGCLVDSCRNCKLCQRNMEQFCPDHCNTYNGTELDKVTLTYGGYSNFITVREHFVCRIPKELPLDAAAPLLCAGITTYAPLRRYNVGKDSRIGIVGFGGVGHVAIKIGVAMGAHVTVISTSESKREDAMKLGAKAFVISTDPEQMNPLKNSLGLVLDTVSASHEVAPLIDLLGFEGVYCIVGLTLKPMEIGIPPLVLKHTIVTGSLIGGMKETQEMLDFCAKHGITCDIEKIVATPESLAVAFERTVKADVKYRFVIDILNSFK